MKYIFLTLLGLGSLVLLLHNLFPDTLSTEANQQNTVYSLLLLSVIGSTIVLHYRNRMGEAVKHLLIWTGIILLLVLGYSFRYEFKIMGKRISGELYPGSAVEVSNGAVQFRISNDGHYYINAMVNNHPVRFMVDTGATDIVLTPKVAARIGINPSTLSFTKFYQTANGTVRGAAVELEEIAIGPIKRYNIPASVNEAAMGHSLLGMRFLKSLSGYEVKNDILTLIP